MPNGVHAMAIRIMQEPERVAVTPSGTVADRVEQVIYPVRAEKKPALLAELLQQKHWDQVLVFSATKTGADVLLSRLRHAGISVGVMHGDKDMRQRKKALDEFVSGKVAVLVATDVAQRGLDIDGISHVVNYDVPRNPEDYIHRIGRTARAGASGTAVTFMTAGEVTIVRDIERLLGRAIDKVSLEGYDWDSNRGAADTRPTAAVNRAGHRFGTRKTADLTPEQLQALLSVG
jgi:ATP-dependent RNA helicase RhlE